MVGQHVKGAFEKAKGAIRNTLGKMAGNKKTQTEGKWDRAKGEIHKKAGDAKDAVKHATKP